MASPQKKTYELDMCHGPLAGKIITFTLPLILSGMLQLLFNAADVIVVGRFAGSESLAAVSFTGQNIGAEEYKRIKPIFSWCTLFVIATAVVLGVIVILSGKLLLGIFSSVPSVIEAGYIRLLYICSTYFLCGIMDVVGGVLRGMGYSVMPMIVSLIGVCGFRLVWVATIFTVHRSTGTLFMSYPITWALTFVTLFLIFAVEYKKLLKHNG